MTASKTLSDKAIKAAIKAAVEAGRTATIKDGGGLSLICRPDGAGWWRLRWKRGNAAGVDERASQSQVATLDRMEHMGCKG